MCYDKLYQHEQTFYASYYLIDDISLSDNDLPLASTYWYPFLHSLVDFVWFDCSF